jgi:hypothetical protein
VYLGSVLFFYATLFVINTPAISYTFQPYAPYFFNEFYTTAKVWLFIIVMPFLALLPDFAYIVCRQNFSPNPSDKLLFPPPSLSSKL